MAEKPKSKKNSSKKKGSGSDPVVPDVIPMAEFVVVVNDPTNRQARLAGEASSTQYVQITLSGDADKALVKQLIGDPRRVDIVDIPSSERIVPDLGDLLTPPKVRRLLAVKPKLRNNAAAGIRNLCEIVRYAQAHPEVDEYLELSKVRLWPGEDMHGNDIEVFDIISFMLIMGMPNLNNVIEQMRPEIDGLRWSSNYYTALREVAKALSNKLNPRPELRPDRLLTAQVIARYSDPLDQPDVQKAVSTLVNLLSIAEPHNDNPLLLQLNPYCRGDLTIEGLIAVVDTIKERVLPDLKRYEPEWNATTTSLLVGLSQNLEAALAA